MHLVEILLPVYDNDGHPFPRADFDRVRAELAQRFGGVTAFSRAPAEGLWKDEEGATSRDDVVIFEVMADELDRAWWADYRETLRQRFRQDELVVRATRFELL
ncbi:MAG TPA: hypothetical protein VFX96_20105 [Pyrinomonadaceae bacterium]|nr:hypothetical protein [Pyrinomonadaceae bacterium]